MGFGAQGLRSITYITHGCWTVLAFLRVEALVEGVGLGFQGSGFRASGLGIGSRTEKLGFSIQLPLRFCLEFYRFLNGFTVL